MHAIERDPLARAFGKAYQSLPAAMMAAICVWQLLVGIKWGIGGWTSIRLTESLSWLYGYSPYGNLTTGPILDNLYGPFAQLPYIVAGVASPNPVICMALAVVTSWMLIVAGFIAIARALGATWAKVFWFCSSLLLFTDVFSPVNLAFRVWADTPAMSFMLLAIAAAIKYPKSVFPQAAALACALWSRQQCVFSTPAFIVFAFWCGGWRQAARFVAAWSFLAILMAALFAACFGARNMWEAMFVMPAHQPWLQSAFPETVTEIAAQQTALEMGKTLAIVAWLQLRHLALLVALGSIVGALVRVALIRSGKPFSSQLAPTALCWGIGLCMLPVACLGRAKIGGTVSHIAFNDVFWLVGFWTLLFFPTQALLANNSPENGLLARSPLRLLMGIGALFCLLSLRLIGSSIAKNPQISQERAAFAYCRAHPGKCYFPWNPLAVLKAEKKIYSLETGVWDFNNAGMTISRELILNTLPDRGRMIAVAPPTGSYIADTYGGWNELRHEMHGLEGWRIFVRAEKDPSG